MKITLTVSSENEFKISVAAIDALMRVFPVLNIHLKNYIKLRFNVLLEPGREKVSFLLLCLIF